MPVRIYSNSEFIPNIRTTFAILEPNYVMQFRLPWFATKVIKHKI